MRERLRKLLMCTAIFAFLVPITHRSAHSEEKEVAAAYRQVISAPNDPVLLDNFLRLLPVVSHQEGGALRTYYVFEGDLLQTRAQIQAALRNKSQDPVSAGVMSGELLINMESGHPTVWAKNERNLTYAIDRASFDSDQHYSEVLRNISKATKDWEDACPACGISFQHRADLDGGSDFSRAMFTIKLKPDETAFIAASFFPNDQPFRRVLIMAPSYFTTDVDHVGVLRHEIGHILGYRHEHIQGIAGCFSEGGEWKPLTAYDSRSVMHYICGGGGTPELQLTPTDIAGHRKAYSP